MKKQNSFSKKIVPILLGIAIIFMAVATVLLFISSSSTSKVNKSAVENASRDDIGTETTDIDGAMPAVNVDNFEVGGTATTQEKEDLYDGEESRLEGEYILPDSDSRYLSEDDLSALTKEELSYARNEIFARHGYIFDSEELKTYFESKDWYEPIYSADSFPDDELNEYEDENAKFIKQYEEDNGFL